MKHIAVSLLLIFSLCTVASAIETKIEVSHEIENGKLYIKGNTNFPQGTKMGVNLYNNSGSYTAQDYDLIIVKDGTFRSAGFSDLGQKLKKGNYTAEIIMYVNTSWQRSQTIINTLTHF